MARRIFRYIRTL